MEAEPLPEASEFITKLEEMLRGGGKLFSPEATTPPSGKDEKSYLAEFFNNRFPPQNPLGHPREEAQKLYQTFPRLKEDLIKRLERNENIQEVNIVRGITLGELADFAKNLFDESAKAKGRADIGSVEYYTLSTDVDYWSKLEEITRSASELEEKNNG